jgi:hypothetical protein
MSDRDHVLKASEIFATSTPFFGTKATIAVAFPEINTISVEVDFGYDYYMGRVIRHCDAKSLPGECIDCRNSRCFGGGFSMGEIVRNMIRDGMAEYSNTIYCRGYEGSPKGRRRYGSCDASFVVRIQVDYKRLPPKR